ncbi:hypothetical protein KUTeg_008854 [Tegillarca granosa]|uniref:DNA 3'-5' helicase n=1 Tax=Tegillarca granosa TaxID=220873 RepID=A0ABQ9FF53_TEGGR|nr:hypothetical protein KUTeg_008854 [Tegillarca granosa]
MYFIQNFGFLNIQSNILLSASKTSEDYQEELDWLKNEIFSKRQLMIKIIIYVNSIAMFERIYIWLSNSSLRVLIVTVAVGMGIDIPNVTLVVMWGLPPSMLQLWQRAGICGRD